MDISTGVGLAFIAMLCWGFGDFFIQKSTRKLGDWATLFVIASFGTIVLLPFVYKNIPGLFTGSTDNLLIMVFSSLSLLCASLLIFEAFKRGKLSVLAPLMSFEIPSASLLAFFVLGDYVTGWQIAAILMLIINLFLVSFHEKNLSHTFFMEKGVLLACFGSFFMGLGDFLLGWGSRVTDPLLANFVLSLVLAVLSGIALVLRGQVRKTIFEIRANPKDLLIMAIADNVAWTAYAFAMVLVPIAVATGLSESSIIIAVLLGLFVNKEHLQKHQKVGLIGAIISAIILAMIT